MSKIKSTAEDIFLHWQKNTEDLGKVRFLAEYRTELLEELCSSLKTYKIDYDDAKFLKKKVVRHLVTEKGMKGNGKYKNWKEYVENEYLKCLALYYSSDFDKDEEAKEEVKSIKRNKVTKIDNYGGEDFMHRDSLIVAWSKDKFKDRWTEAICLECHRTFGPLLNLFEEEVLHSKWAVGNAEVPKWAKPFFAK